MRPSSILTARLRARVNLGDASTALFVGFQPALAKTSSRRLSEPGARHVLQTISRRAGIPQFHPHQLRDTFGSIVQRETGDLAFIATTLGYADLRSVAGYLPKPTDQRQAARKALEAAGV